LGEKINEWSSNPGQLSLPSLWGM